MIAKMEEEEKKKPSSTQQEQIDFVCSREGKTWPGIRTWPPPTERYRSTTCATTTTAH